MDFLIAILMLALIALVFLIVSAPLRRARRLPGVSDPSPVLGGNAESLSDEEPATPDYVRDELEAAREAKYREIRDTELDYRTGKLSREDYQTIDADLRAEAIEILDRLEALRPRDA